MFDQYGLRSVSGYYYGFALVLVSGLTNGFYCNYLHLAGRDDNLFRTMRFRVNSGKLSVGSLRHVLWNYHVSGVLFKGFLGH